MKAIQGTVVMDARELLRHALESNERDAPGRRCPDESALAAFADGSASSLLRARVEAHAADCGFCRRQLVLVMRLQEAALETTIPAALLEQARQPRRRGWLARLVPARWPAIAALGSCAVLAFAVAVSVRRPPVALAPSVPIPSAAERSATRSTDVAAVPHMTAPVAEDVVDPAVFALQWVGVGGADFYDVTITNEAGDLVWSAEASASPLRVPASAALLPGQRYFVWVSARVSGNRTLRSPAVPFRVRQ